MPADACFSMQIFLNVIIIVNYTYECVHVTAGAFGGQRHQITLELESQEVVSYPVWVPGTKLKPSARAGLALIH